jgi:hypothetical protein
MKNPKQFPWRRRLPVHRPDEHLWGKIASDKSLDRQIESLKAELPLAQPKTDLWLGIEKSLKKRKTIVLWSRIASAAAVLLIGSWGATALLTKPTATETRFFLTTISEDLGESIHQPFQRTIPETKEEPLSDTESQNHIQPIYLGEKSENRPEKEQVEVAIPLPDISIVIPDPEVSVARIDRSNEFTEEVPITSYAGKKTITVTWDDQPRVLKIDGFNVTLSEKEIQILQELEDRKKGKFKFNLNTLSARLYEK